MKRENFISSFRQSYQGLDCMYVRDYEHHNVMNGLGQLFDYIEQLEAQLASYTDGVVAEFDGVPEELTPDHYGIKDGNFMFWYKNFHLDLENKYKITIQKLKQ